MPFEQAGVAFAHFAAATAGSPGHLFPVPKRTMRYRVTVPEGTYVVLMGRAVKSDGTAIQQSDVVRVTVRVYKTPKNKPTSELYSSTLVTSAVIFDTLQTQQDDTRWREDTTGYNFLAIVDAPQVLATSGQRFAYQVRIDTTSDGPIKQVYDVFTEADLAPA